MLYQDLNYFARDGLTVCVIVPEGVLPERDTGRWAGVDGALAPLGSRKSPKPEKCLKTAQNPTRRLHALLGGGFSQLLLPR